MLHFESQFAPESYCYIEQYHTVDETFHVWHYKFCLEIRGKQGDFNRR